MRHGSVVITDRTSQTFVEATSKRAAEDGCTQHRNLTVLHGPFLSCGG